MIPLPPHERRMVGGYQLLGELGRGAMGRVYLAVGPDRRPVALKEVDPSLNSIDGFRERFRHEVAASGQVTGSHIATVLASDTEAAVPWLVSEFVPGPSLGETLAASGPMTEQSATQLLLGLAHALADIHRAGLVHRDLKPSNIMLNPDGLKVIDFGIARAVGDMASTALTRTGHTLGTPEFMSPEQAASKPLTGASDVFSMATVVVNACTGRSPFEAGSLLDTMNRVVNDNPDLGTVPERLRPILQSCLMKDPMVRPSPQQVIDAIGEVAPLSRPWPPYVDSTAAEQHAALGSLLGQSQSWPTQMAPGATQVQPASGMPFDANAWPPPNSPMSPAGGPMPPPGVMMPPPAPANKSSAAMIGIGVTAAVVAVITVLAVVIVALGNSDDDHPDNASDDTSTTDETTDAYTTDTYTTEEEPPPNLDDEAYDTTPIDQDSLLADSFIDSQNVQYTLAGGDVHDCMDTADSDGVSGVLSDVGCDDAVIGTYIDDSDQILVSVVVIPLSTTDVADSAYNDLLDYYADDWTMWCPQEPSEADAVCDQDLSYAVQYGYITYDHRYLIHSRAIYINLTEDSSAEEWLDPASSEVVDVVGPENYTGY